MSAPRGGAGIAAVEMCAFACFIMAAAVVAVVFLPVWLWEAVAYGWRRLTGGEYAE